MTTVVTTVDTENCVTTHAIFFSSTDAQCRTPFLRKNHVLQSDCDNDDDAKVHATLTSAKERRAKNDDEHAFAVVATIARTSQVCAGSSHIVGTLQNCVSQAVGVRSDDGPGEMRM